MLQQKLKLCSYEDSFLQITDFSLHSGKKLKEISIAYRIHGSRHNPLVFVLGGISAHRGLNDGAGDKKAWWKDMVGPHKCVDTERFCVVGFDYLGGDGGTTGADTVDWPLGLSVDTIDQGMVILEIMKAMGHKKVHAVVGASYGAMVGIAFSQKFPEHISKVIAISGAHRSHPMSMAWRHLQREMLLLADQVKRSDNEDLGKRLVALSRALAMTTYRTPEEFEQRFNSIDDVVSYLEYHGRSFAESRHHKSYYCLSESIDKHNIALEKNNVTMEVIGFEEDRLVPKRILQELAMKTSGQLHLFHSTYGHDAFLKEFNIFNRLLPTLLEGHSK